MRVVVVVVVVAEDDEDERYFFCFVTDRTGSVLCEEFIDTSDASFLLQCGDEGADDEIKPS